MSTHTEIADALQVSASLVKEWGGARLPSGRTVAAALTCEDVPFWDAFAVDLARLHVPSVLARTSNPPNQVVMRLRPRLSRAKHWARGLVAHRHSATGCSTWPLGPTVMSLGFSHYLYRDLVHPIAQQLADVGQLNSVSLGDRAWPASMASTGGMRMQTIWQHWRGDTTGQAARLRRALRGAEAELRAPGGLPAILRDGRRPLWDQLRSVFEWLFRTYIPLLVPHALVASHILEKHRPAAVISSDVADPRTRLYTLACRRMGIPSLEVQTGPIGTEGVEVEWAFMEADCVAAWGETSRVAIQGYGVPAHRIVTIGSARHDRMFNVPAAEVHARRAQLNVPPGHVMVVFASGYRLKTYDQYSDLALFESMKRAIFQTADRTPNLTVVVKPHPLEDVSETKTLVGRCRNVVFADRESDIRDLTRVCDGFVSFGSTATADALVARKLSMCLAFPGWMWNDLFQQSGAVLALRSTTDVEQAFQSIADGMHEQTLATLEPARQQFLDRWVHRADGRAAQRIAALICQMAGMGG